MAPQDVETGPSPAFTRHMYLLAGTFFFVFMGAGAQQAYLVPYLGKVTTWSRLDCSIVIATVYLSMMFFRIVNLKLFPNWSDRRYTIVGSLSYLLFTLCMWGTAHLGSYPFAILSAAVWGMGAAMMWTGTVMQTLSLSDTAGGRHGTGMGILYFSTHAGWLAGATVLGKIYNALPDGSYPRLYLVAAGITLIGNLLAFGLPSTGKAVREPPCFKSMLAICTSGRTAVAGILQFASSLGYGLVLGLFSGYIEETYGKEWIWIAIALYPGTRMVVSAVGGHLTDRIGHVPVLVVSFLTGAAGLLVSVLLRSPIAAVVTGFALGLLGSVVPVVAAAIIGNAADRKRRPLTYGIIFSYRDLGVVVSAVGANILGLQFEFRTVFIVFAAVFAGCALLSLLLRDLTEDV